MEVMQAAPMGGTKRVIRAPLPPAHTCARGTHIHTHTHTAHMHARKERTHAYTHAPRMRLYVISSGSVHACGPAAQHGMAMHVCPHLVRREEVEHEVGVKEEVDKALHPEPKAGGRLVEALHAV